MYSEELINGLEIRTGLNSCLRAFRIKESNDSSFEWTGFKNKNVRIKKLNEKIIY